MTVWCWVRDLHTGHRYDVPLSRLAGLEAAGAVREIPGRRRRAYVARRPKPLRRLGGGAAIPRLPAGRPAETEEQS